MDDKIFRLLGKGAVYQEKHRKENEIFKKRKIDKSKASLKVENAKVDSSGKSLTEEEIKVTRKSNQIKVYGSDIPSPYPEFGVDRLLISNLLKEGITCPTPIQMQSIPIVLERRDLIACASTGSGKTLAFLLPIIQSLLGTKHSGFRGLILSPTKELATQIFNTFRTINEKTGVTACLCTKAFLQGLKGNKTHNYDVLISTPLRLVGGIKDKIIDLSSVEHIVFDEADKLLDDGFLEQIDDILSACTNENLQKSLFSATISSGVEEIANSFMNDSIRIVIGSKGSAASLVEQKLIYVGQEEGKLMAFKKLLADGIKPPVLLFVQSIEKSTEIFNELVYFGINVAVISSEKSEEERATIIRNFRMGKIWVLITTELLGRGIDFKAINLVINYDCPQSIASYIHRIGRTGRAGRKGKAVTFFTDDDSKYLKGIANVMRESGSEVEEWMLQLQKGKKTNSKRLKKKRLAMKSKE